MKKVFSFIFIMALVVCSVPAFSADFNLVLTDNSSVQNSNARELILEFESTQAVSGVCPMMVKRLEYFAAANLLVLDSSREEPCLLENYGKVRGFQKWIMPVSLLARNGETRILINGKNAGKMVIQNGRVKMVPAVEPQTNLQN